MPRLDIDALVAGLSATDRQALYSKLGYALSEKEKARISIAPAEEVLVWDALVDVTGWTRPFPAFIKTFTKQRFVECVTIAEELIARGCGELLRRPEKAEILRCAFGCLAADLRGRLQPIPATPATLLQNIASLEHAIDMRYPGYIACRLFGQIVKFRKAGVV